MKLYILAIFTFIFSTNQLSAQSNPEQITAIICGKLIDGKSGKARNNAVILVAGERIIEVGDKELISPDYQLIDLSDYTVLPGMIDAHTHPLIYGDDYQTNHLKGTSAYNALHGLKVVQNWLNEGWTTIRIAGDADVNYAHFEIRDAINEGLFKGPRIFGAGHYLSITGGGGDINYISNEQSIITDGLIVDGKEEMIKTVRKEIKNGSDWIKLLVTGAFMSAGDNPQNVHFSDEEISTAVEEANRRNIPVMAHAHATKGINQAIKLGARSIEHGTFLDDESIRLFLEYDAYLIPTIYIGEYALETFDADGPQAKNVEITKKYRDASREGYKKAIKAGVKVGVGSDNVGFPPNFAANEFGQLVDLGMSPMEAIKAGTIVNAELLQKEQDLGSIEVGKLADIIATKGNPLQDISELTRVKFVMKGGELIKLEE
ncbi:metal-dependent hydrolase family protein [Chondrinema litorale]|uniref:metal-dependent hydrolase family protein n=1 Tax=Chondrinema litorale TaxID=2994555 RepID=UPI002543835F|nr:amidohydrolase family protein [Chondrinema litorale]UZR98855.1 amidohydrolase family protein [Chondrinema litorale]